MSDQEAHVFISHASHDAATATSLCAALEAAGVACWIAPRDVRPGEAYAAAIVNAINSARMLLLILGEEAISSPHVLREVERASSKRRPILAVRMDDTQLPAELEYFLSVNHWLDGDGVPLEQLIPRVVDAVRTPGAAPRRGAVSQTSGGEAIARPLGRNQRLLVGAALALAVAVLLFWFVDRTRAPSPERSAVSVTPHADAIAPEPVSRKPRIAVLPFENLSPDPDNAFFTDGVHEEILTSLANHASGLDVISRTTMATYKGKAVTMQSLAADLHCHYVLEGSVRREGSQVRLSLQLIDARTDARVWGQDYDRKLVSAMALETEVAAAVASQLSLKFAGTDTLSSTDPLAYDIYLKAKAADAGARTLEDERAAIKLLDQAIERDPQFVRAYLARMQFRAALFHNNDVPPNEALPEEHRDLDAAQRLAPTSPTVQAYAAVFAYIERDYVRSLSLFEQAEAQGFADPDLLDWKNDLLFAMGRYREAAALSRRLADLDPRNQTAQWRWLYVLMSMHQFPEALRLADIEIERGQNTADWQLGRANVLYYGGGKSEPRRAFFGEIMKTPLRTQDEVDENILDVNMELMLEHRFQDLRTLLDSITVTTWNCAYIHWPLRRAGFTPIADMRGWTDLVLGDEDAAKRDGRQILDFLEQNPATKWNGWYHEMLRADAQLFLGDGSAANRTAAAALLETRSTPDVSDQMNALVMGTRILAWSDAKQQAVQRLVELSTARPGLGPGEIGGAPIYSIPLASVPAYRNLVAGLSAKMRASGIQ